MRPKFRALDSLEGFLLEISSFTLGASLRQLEAVLGCMLQHIRKFLVIQLDLTHKFIHRMSHAGELGLISLDLFLQTFLKSVSLGQLELGIPSGLISRSVNARAIFRRLVELLGELFDSTLQASGSGCWTRRIKRLSLKVDDAEVQFFDLLLKIRLQKDVVNGWDMTSKGVAYVEFLQLRIFHSDFT
jgi:hypothetical protein